MNIKSKIFLACLSVVLAMFAVTPNPGFCHEWTWQNPLPQGNTLHGLLGSSSSDVFAGGSYGAMRSYNGSNWTPMNGGTATDFNGVWGSFGSDVFAVGVAGTIIHYDGSTWSSMASGTTNNLNSVWGSSGNDVFAVGDGGTIIHYGETPTVISLFSFTVTPSNKEVIIRWLTESETDNAGFNLFRAEAVDGEYEKLNDFLIPAKGSSTQGATYEFIDSDVKNRKTYYYKLEDIDLQGVSTSHGPIKATPKLIHGFFK